MLPLPRTVSPPRKEPEHSYESSLESVTHLADVTPQVPPTGTPETGLTLQECPTALINLSSDDSDPLKFLESPLSLQIAPSITGSTPMKKRVPNLAQDTKSTKRPRTAAPPPLALGQLSLLRGTSRAQRAHFRLSRFRSRKKSYSGTGLVCVLCSHSHHSISTRQIHCIN